MKSAIGILASSYVAPATSAPPVSGYALWLDAADTATITHSANAVSQWDDKSGNARHVSQGTAANRPTTNVATQNGRNVIRFDGTNDILSTSSSWAMGSDYTWFVVFKVPTTATRYILNFDETPGGSDHAIISQWSSRPIEHFIGGSYGARYQIGTGSTSGWNVVTHVRAAQSHTSFLNGSASGSGTSTAMPAWTATTRVGGSGLSEFADTDIAELVVYTSALGSTDRASVESYLKTKWSTP